LLFQRGRADEDEICADKPAFSFMTC